MQIEAAAPLVSDKQDTLRPLRTRIIFEYVPEITESWQAPQAPSSCMLPLGIKISAFHDWLRPDADIPRRGKTILMPDDLFS